MGNSNNEVMEVLERYSQEINNEIEKVLSTIEPVSLKKASIHLTKAGGKMLRPALTVLVSEAVGGDKKDAIKSAAAIELIHTFSLIHDDIMDQDDMRRGMPSVHKLWGEPVAILAGDTLFSKAFELVINTKVDGTSLGNESFERINQTLATVADACVKICEGQAFDMGFEGNFDVKEDEYIDMIFKKTAALIAAATEAGAIMGGADEKIVSAMYDYGKLIGLAFQIQDDYLDVVSDEKSLGKPVGSDITEGKMTLLVVKSLAEANDKDKKRLIEILKFSDTSPENVSEAIDIFEKYGSIKYAYDVAMGNVENAKQLLEILDDSEAKQALSLIADFVVKRQN
ncbi:MAG: polyprenyl synthetase family protein [Methanobacteriaceae archaeon]|jgi:geranylgeranyl diphosphate synthase type I|nr:polyprenyl synthetase family protein [Candidatus Methanorudis spinitermitis]